MTERSPYDTSAADPLEKLMVAAGGIEAQEAQGAREMVQATTLPTKTNQCDDRDFEALGFTFGPPLENDPLFRPATLPEGWSRKGTDHSMWTAIVDERGIERVSIFYKAAFYDRDAFMNINNVGYKIASDFIYGDEEAYTPHEGLTPEEVEHVRERARGYLRDAEQYPDIYKAGSRAQQVLDAHTLKD